MAPPFRADQVGSLLRPEALLEARRKAGADSSQAPSEEVLHIQQDAIKSVVQKQLDLNIRPIMSGEYERPIFSRGFMERLEGFSVIDVPFLEHRPGFPTIRHLSSTGMTSRPEVVATGKIRHAESPYLEDWLFLRSLIPRERWHEAKMTLISPVYYHALLDQSTYTKAPGYSNDDDFFKDVVTAYATEIKILYDHGLRVLQIDDPNILFFIDEESVSQERSLNQNFEALFDQYIAVHNTLLDALPADLTVGIHLCRGNMPKSTHLMTGGYDGIAQKLFQSLNYHLYYLEFDTPRAGSFEPLRFLPKEKAAVLGLVSTKSGEMESKDLLKRRVMEAAKLIADGQQRSIEEVLRDNLAISPQCGFSSMATGGGVGVTEEIMWKKLELVRDVAAEVWPDAA